MKVCVLCDSRTGNTEQLADVIREVYSGNLVEDTDQADIVFLGSWTDKGSCSDAAREVAASLHGKQVFLFGTCGFGGSDAYYEQIFHRTAALLDSSNRIVGRFYCQGKMPVSVKERYQNMLRQDPGNQRMKASLENFDRALSHPDGQDLQRLRDTLAALSLS